MMEKYKLVPEDCEDYMDYVIRESESNKEHSRWIDPDTAMARVKELNWEVLS